MWEPISILGNTFILHPSGALFWKDRSMLLIADVHFGKVAHFRKYGAAIPANVPDGNYDKLKTVISEFLPETICFLGDLFHSKINMEWKAFENWISNTQLDIILISGNHDIIPNYLFEELGVSVLDVIETDGFLLTHHPTEKEGLFNFCGHIHPGVEMRNVGKQYLKLACFFKMENQLILPAFGNFTGKYILTPKETDEVYVIVDGEIICVSK